ncbi:hypothetical protein SCA6_011554 [Theobroma cacao]
MWGIKGTKKASVAVIHNLHKLKTNLYILPKRRGEIEALPKLLKYSVHGSQEGKMSWTVADAVDYKGFPADRSKTGGWIPAALILGMIVTSSPYISRVGWVEISYY